LFDYLAESHDEDLNRLLSEERQRCDALAADNDSMFHLLEEIKAQNLQIENNLKEKFQEEIRNKEKQFNSQINQIQSEV
jgi:exonuclease VII large subunit